MTNISDELKQYLYYNLHNPCCNTIFWIEYWNMREEFSNTRYYAEH